MGAIEAEERDLQTVLVQDSQILTAIRTTFSCDMVPDRPRPCEPAVLLATQSGRVCADMWAPTTVPTYFDRVEF